jgi:hypothetical protein
LPQTPLSTETGRQGTAASQPLLGRDRVASFALEPFENARRLGVSFEPAVVNGGPGIITHDPQGRIANVLSLEILDGVIQTLRGLVNPDKLQRLGPVTDITRIGRRDDDFEA